MTARAAMIPSQLSTIPGGGMPNQRARRSAGFSAMTPSFTASASAAIPDYFFIRSNTRESARIPGDLVLVLEISLQDFLRLVAQELQVQSMGPGEQAGSRDSLVELLRSNDVHPPRR